MNSKNNKKQVSDLFTVVCAHVTQGGRVPNDSYKSLGSGERCVQQVVVGQEAKVKVIFCHIHTVLSEGAHSADKYSHELMS